MATGARWNKLHQTRCTAKCKYLIFSADHLRPSIQDEFTGEQLDLADLEVSASLSSRILEWNDAYQPIIPVVRVERERLATHIDSLDALGLTLARDLEGAMSDVSKVKYYSEGRHKLLNPP
ncbi:MAG: hypothetical protein QM711_14430 [Micropruina sp.]|uniref:hypothetical protein n=1 Tax=Micropruina sp. TaxID=2737536 RepID=UPI0039E262F4